MAELGARARRQDEQSEQRQPVHVHEGAPLANDRLAVVSGGGFPNLRSVDGEAIAPNLIAAHATVRPIKTISVWGRHVEKAKDLADTLDIQGTEVHVVTDLSSAVGKADIISCATLAHQPLIQRALASNLTMVSWLTCRRTSM